MLIAVPPRLRSLDGRWLAVALCALPMAVLGWARLRLQLPMGDEPHYLAVSQALLRYGSLDVQRVYDHADYWTYYPMWLEPHVSPGPDGQPLPLHSIGGPVLWLVPFALGGRAGVVAFMTVVSLLVVANIHRLVRLLGGNDRLAVLVAVAFGIGTPLLTYAGMSFVEPLGALGCVYALRLLHEPRLRPRDLLLVSAALGALPWIHSRFLLFPPIFLALFAVRVLREREPGTRARLLCALGPAVALLAGLVFYNALVWGTVGLAANQVNAGAVPFTAAPWRALVGVALDQEVGVIPNFPVLVIALAGLLVAGRRHRALTLHVAAVVVPYVLVVTSFPAWDGAWSPPARFLAVVLPMLAGHVALALRGARPVVVVASVVLVVIGGALTAIAVATDSGGFSAQSGISPALARVDALLGLDLTPWVPSLPAPGQAPLFTAWGVTTALVALLVAAPVSRPTPIGQRGPWTWRARRDAAPGRAGRAARAPSPP